MASLYPPYGPCAVEKAKRPGSRPALFPHWRACPLWTQSEQTIAGQNRPLSALVQKRTNGDAVRLSAKCHKQTSHVWFEMKEAANVGGLTHRSTSDRNA